MNRPSVAGSRLLARLEADIRKTPHPIDNACLRAERASQLARVGQYDAAREEIAALHSAFDRQANPAVSAWLCLAEGCLTYYTSLETKFAKQVEQEMAISHAVMGRLMSETSKVDSTLGKAMEERFAVMEELYQSKLMEFETSGRRNSRMRF